MTLRVDVYGTASQRRADMAVFFPYPWGGERHNNTELLKTVAALSGAMVVGAQTPGTGRVYIDRATRKQLRPGAGFAALAADYAGEVHEFLEREGRPTRVLAAQSGRVALGARMQTSEHHPFTHALLRDGVILSPPRNLVEGLQRMGAQPGQGEVEEGRGGPDEHKSVLHRVRDFRARWHGRAEAIAQRRLLCSDESIQAVAGLADDISTPLHHITFARGIAGSVEDQARFNDKLLRLRAKSALAQGATEESFGVTAPLTARVEAGNHADLQNPLLLHGHIMQTVDLHNFGQSALPPGPEGPAPS